MAVDEPSAGREQGVPPPEAPKPRRNRVPAEIRNVSFPISVRGYDRRAVDAYIQRVNRVIAELEVSRSPQAAVRHAVDRVTEQTKGIVEQARDSAEQIIATAREEADQTLAEAKAEAADLVVNASAEADRVKAEAQQVLADARAEAEAIAASAQAEAAEERQRSEAELVELETQAAARMRDLQADTDAVWNERDGLLEEIGAMAERLREAARAASVRAPHPDAAEPAEDPEAVAEPVFEDAATAVKPPRSKA